MEPSELRINNLVTVTNGTRMPLSTVFKIVTIKLFQVDLVRHYQIPAQVETFFQKNYYELTPIPLTEDWLNKFGFKAQEIMDADGYTKTKHFYIRNFQVEFWENSVWGENVFVYNEAQTILVSHVHSLQNLYYSLCGEELKLN